MYFKFFKLHSWGKRSGDNCRRLIQRLPREEGRGAHELRQHQALGHRQRTGRAGEPVRLALRAKPYIRGSTYRGGEPFDPHNQPALLALTRKLRARLPEKTVWSFTGYVYEKNLPQVDGVTQELLGLLDVLVDGPFIADKKNLTLRFRGSENQRLIDMPQTLKTGAIVLWDETQ